jgi:hypothetical protein
MKTSFTIKGFEMKVKLPAEIIGTEQPIDIDIKLGEISTSLEDVTLSEVTAHTKELVKTIKDLVKESTQESI